MDFDNIYFFWKCCKKITLHDRLLIFAAYLANKIVKQNGSKIPAHTGIVIETYRKICQLTDAEPSGDTYMSSRLKALDVSRLFRRIFTKVMVIPNLQKWLMMLNLSLIIYFQRISMI